MTLVECRHRAETETTTQGDQCRHWTCLDCGADRVGPLPEQCYHPSIRLSEDGLYRCGECRGAMTVSLV